MQQPSDVSFGGRPVPTDWPSADSVASKRGPSKRHIPKGARKLWATCLLSALAAVAAYNDVRAWTDLLCLPKLVLAADSRGGRKHQLRIEANTKQKCQRWLEGDRNSLWQQYQNQKINRRDVSTDVTESRKHGRVDELLQESLMQQACNALGKAPPVSISSDILAELQSKHPPARPLDLARLRTLRGVSPAAATLVTPEDVEKAIRDFSMGSGPGPFGLRPQHLKEALVPGVRDELLRQCAAVINIMAQGKAPSELQPLICGASLHALPKLAGDHRPVACGDTWRRLCAKCLASQVKDAVTEYLFPMQLGVGVRGATEAIVHVLRQWLARSTGVADRVVVTLDIENAFNSVDRSAILSSVRRVLPCLAPWADFCYRNDSVLFADEHRIGSACGIQQGDPLGPALFAIALQDAIRRAREEADSQHPGGIDWVAFYLDDGTVAGSGPAVAVFVEKFIQEVSELGFVVNLDKCDAIPAAGANTTVDRTRLGISSGRKTATSNCWELPSDLPRLSRSTSPAE